MRILISNNNITPQQTVKLSPDTTITILSETTGAGVKSILVDRSVGEKQVRTFLNAFLMLVKTGRVILDNDFRLITDFDSSMEQSLKDLVTSVNSPMWRKVSDKVKITNLTVEVRNTCLAIYSKVKNDVFSPVDICSAAQLSPVRLTKYMPLLVSGGFMEVCHQSYDDYSPLKPMRYKLTRHCAEEIILLKGSKKKNVKELERSRPPKLPKTTNELRSNIRKNKSWVEHFKDSVFGE